MAEQSDSNTLFLTKLTCSYESIQDDWLPAGNEAISVERDAEALMNGNLAAGPGDLIPVILADHGRAVVSVAQWGHSQGQGVPEYYRLCTGQTLGYPCLMPATEVLLRVGLELLSVRMRDLGRMYVGCMYFQESRGTPIEVVPLFLPSGSDIAEFADFQPLLIPVKALPRPGIWDFITPYGTPHLRKPLPEGSLVVGPINYQTSVLGSA